MNSLHAFRTAALGLAVFGCLLGTERAHAQTVCIPDAVGVPFLGGPPNWFNSALAQPQFWPEVDDPRWRGSFLRTFGGGASSAHVTYRALRTATDLYLSWNITVDPKLDEVDEVWVAFSPGVGQDDVLIQVTPFSNSTPNVPLQPPAAVQVLTRPSGSAFSASPTVPAWLATATTSTRVLRVGTEGRWAVLMRVPITAPPNGVNLANAFKTWFGVMVSHPAGIAEYDDPAGIHLDSGPNNVLASTTNAGWTDTARNLSPTDASCIKGVSLVASDIGTDPGGACTMPIAAPPPALSTSLSLKKPSGTPGTFLPGTNILCARALNGGPGLGAGDVNATFRIANWGTQPANPTSISNAWVAVNPATPALASGPIATNARGDLKFTWNLTANDGTVNDACTFTPQPTGMGCGALPASPRWAHQCMLVELNGAPGVTLSTSSVSQNMNFVGASQFKEEAEVSVKGLPPPPGSPPRRDVYLYVQTTNMPEHVPAGPPPAPQPPRTFSIPRTTHGEISVPSEGDTGTVTPLEKTPYEQLRETKPTYEVHGFHDTGLTTTLHGHSYKLLEPQSSFGYFVDHGGDLFGWRHELVGATQIAPDYYRIRVPQDGARTVTNIIEAMDSRWSLSVQGGINFPQGTCDSGGSLSADLEYRINARFAGALFYGRDWFDCSGTGAHANHLSLNAKAYFGSIRWRPFIGAGVGQYDFSTGTNGIGFNVFGGLQANPQHRLALEVTARYHVVGTTGDPSKFLTAQAGIRVRF